MCAMRTHGLGLRWERGVRDDGPMQRQGSGRRVLRFAVSGALVGGAAVGCASTKSTTNMAPVEHTNVGPEVEPHSNVGPEDEPHTNPGPVEPAGAAEPSEPHVNTAPVAGPPSPGEPEPPRVMVNPAPQPEPAPKPGI